MSIKKKVQSYKAKSRVELASLKLLIGLLFKLPNLGPLAARQFAEVVENVLDPLTGTELKKLISAYNSRRFAAIYLIIKQRIFGIKSSTGIVRCEVSADFTRSWQKKEPIIVLFWHSPMDKIRFSALHKLNLSPFLVSFPRSPFSFFNQASLSTVRSPDERVVARDTCSNGILLKTLLEHLNHNGIIFIFLDGRAGNSSVPVRFFNRTIVLRRGAASLARRSKAAVYTAMNQWNQETGEYRFQIGPKLPSPKSCELSSLEWDQTLLQAGVSCFESFFKNHPEEIGPKIFHILFNLKNGDNSKIQNSAFDINTIEEEES